jgi:hypothetical protein
MIVVRGLLSRGLRRGELGHFDLGKRVEHRLKFFVCRDMSDFDSLGGGAGDQQAFIDHCCQCVRDLGEREFVAFVDQALTHELSGFDHITAGSSDSGVKGFGSEKVTDFSHQANGEMAERRGAARGHAAFQVINAFLVSFGAGLHEEGWGSFLGAGGEEVFCGLLRMKALAGVGGLGLSGRFSRAHGGLGRSLGKDAACSG